MAVRGLQTENFLLLEILSTFCPGGKRKEKTSRGMKISSVPSFSCVLLFLLGSLFSWISVFITWKLKTGFTAIQDLFSITFLSAQEVWEIKVDIYWRKEEMGVTLLILLFSQCQDSHLCGWNNYWLQLELMSIFFFPEKAAQPDFSELFASPYTREGGKRSVFIPARYGDSWGNFERLPDSGWCWQQSLEQVSWDGCGVALRNGEAVTVFPTALEPFTKAICFPLGTTALLWVVAVIKISTAAVLPPSFRCCGWWVRCSQGPACPFPRCRGAMLRENAFPFPTW